MSEVNSGFRPRRHRSDTKLTGRSKQRWVTVQARTVVIVACNRSRCMPPQTGRLTVRQ
jgi:hypothetical protein